MSHHNMVHKPIPLTTMKIPQAKAAALDKEWTKLQKLPAWDESTTTSKNRGDTQSKMESNTVQFATFVDLCHLKNSELEKKFQT